MVQELTRRNFIGGASVAALASAVALVGCSNSAAGGNSASVTPAATTTPEQAAAEGWDYAADVVICGFGVAGVMAAREAMQQGLSYIVLEAASHELAGGSTCAMGGYYVPLTQELFLATGDEFSPEEAQTLADQCVADYTWMAYNGMTANDFMKVDGAGQQLYAIMQQAMDAAGANVLYETKAVELVADPATNEVFGVVAETANGNRIRVAGRKGVLLATGGFSENQELINQFMFPDVQVYNAGSPYCDGQGLLMGLSVNAALHNMTNRGIELQAFCAKKASDELGTALVSLPSGEHRGARIIVNQAGARFMNEEMYVIHYKGNLPWLEFPGNAEQGYQGLINMPMYMIFDSKILGSEAVANFLSDYSWAYSKGVYTWTTNNQEELSKGWIAQGETLEELAANLAEQSGNDAIDAESLKATVEAYNIGANGGSDAFGRSEMEALEGPFYAIELGMASMYTIGGLTCGLDGRTLDNEGDHIEGLWHAGDIGQIRVVNPEGCCPAGATAALAMRDMATVESREIAGDVATECEPAPEDAVAIASGGLAVLMGAAGMEAAENAEVAGAGEDFTTEAGAAMVAYVDGTYEGVGNSAIGGDIVIAVNVEDANIASIDIVEENETEDVGKKALPVLIDQAVASNGLQVDTISGATNTSTAFKAALAEALTQAAQG